MLLISHRGNLDCDYSQNENSHNYIDAAIDAGYNVEIDMRWYNSSLYLGHTTPDYKVDISWLISRKEYLWIHCKDLQSLYFLVDYDIRTFFHKTESHFIVSNTKKIIWSHAVEEATQKSIIPLINLKDIELKSYPCGVYGVCSNYVKYIKETPKVYESFICK